MNEPHFQQEPIVALRQAALRIRNRRILEGTSWEVRQGEHWAVVGPNGAGKSTLVRALAGAAPVVQGAIFPADPMRLRGQAAVVSFERQRGMMAREDQEEVHRHFSGDQAGGRRVEDFFSLPGGRARRRLILPPAFRIEHLLDRRIRELSTGEIRRFQIALALASAPRLLILDEPFEGLDFSFRSELAVIINGLMDSERAVVLVAHRRREILPHITHILGVKDGAVVFQGPREEPSVQEGWQALYAAHSPPRIRLPLSTGLKAGPSAEPLIELHDVTVVHDGIPVFKNLSWVVRAGEHWALCGPNGSGKTTLLSLIAGDHPQAYANRVRVFGERRGGGRSIRELKSGIGFISAELQVRYRTSVTAAEAVLSGFFDSVGLYRRASPRQQAAANALMESLGISHLAAKKFNHLSQGEQRMVLLGRAMIKLPRLLVLDEPCQGLDSSNRRLILEAVDRIAAAGATTLLYVSHHADEIPACMTHRLRLVRDDAGPSRAVFSSSDQNNVNWIR
jgi:molybdate transport system ATP-binding protein